MGISGQAAAKLSAAREFVECALCPVDGDPRAQESSLGFANAPATDDTSHARGILSGLTAAGHGLAGVRALRVIYRVLAERRKRDREAPYLLGGVVVAGAWHPAAPGVEPASVRQMEAGLVRVEPLPPFLAPDDATAVAVALQVAEAVMGDGITEPGPSGWDVVAPNVREV